MVIPKKALINKILEKAKGMDDLYQEDYCSLFDSCEECPVNNPDIDCFEFFQLIRALLEEVDE